MIASASVSLEPATLAGVPISPGSAIGPARVIGNGDAWQISPGDILVVGALRSSLTPLFRLAGGVVAETVVVLSEPAIVAREMRLPVVAGIKHATSLIADGQQIRIDGTNGFVRVG